MRDNDIRNGADPEDARPRYMVWENVPGAFSSNGGKDFQAVLTEIARVAEPDAPDVPLPEKGKWSKAGCLYGAMGEWSIAWRVHDAQFWGVPQRRKRISLVADFGGLSAPEILFERKGLSGDFEQSRTTREEATGGAGKGVESSGEPLCFEPRSQDGCARIHMGGVTPTLNTAQGGQRQPCVMCIGNGQANQSIDDKAGALNCMHDQQAVMVSAVDCRNLNEHQEVSGTLQCKQNGGYSLNYQNPIMVQGAYKNAETRSKTLLLLQETYGEETILKWGTAILERLQQADILQQGVYESRISGEAEKWNELDDCALPRTELVTGWMLRDLWKQQKCGRSPQGWESAEQQSGQFAESLPKLSQQNSQACKDLFDMWQKGEGLWLLREALSEIQKIWKSLNGQRQSVYGHPIVRRLTPLEAERLQGYPDGWTDIGEWTDTKGKKHKPADSPRYKALGNSIAIPPWLWVLSRLNEYCEEKTMASLFDGIGGFPLIWEFLNGTGSAVWCSEIEEFPIAVTKIRFPDKESE